MPNHFHLVVLCALERLTRGMHFLNFRYAQRFNERHDRVGHLFQSRFGARSVEGDEHLHDVCEYVLDNAVRAGLCATRDGMALVRRRVAAATYADACTGESAGAHEQSGEASPLRPFRRR